MAKNRVHPAENREKNKNRNGITKHFNKNKVHRNRDGPGHHKNVPDAAGDDHVVDKPSTFNKKEWRLKKYSKKYRLDQWDEKRKKKILNQYYKDLKSDGGTEKFTKTLEDDSPKKINYVVHPDVLERLKHTDAKKKASAYKCAQMEFERIKREREQKREDVTRQKAERVDALQKYKHKKTEAYKKLSRKTKKGQPVMKGRIELMLEKIQASRETEV